MTALLYSLLGLGLTTVLGLNGLFTRLSTQAKDALVVLVLIPEAVAFYEILNQYSAWIARGFPLGDPYFIFMTKTTGVILFLMIGFQFVVLRSGK